MMRTRTKKPLEFKGPYQPGVIIAAELAFAALLLYLINQPFEIDSATTKAPVDEPSGIPVEVITISESNVAVVASRFIDSN